MTMCVTRHIPNIITVARLALTPLLVYFIVQGEYMGAVVVFNVICLTDFSDGAAARALGVCTQLGTYMDVFADLLYIMASLVVLNIKGLAPVWFTVIVALKFLEFAVTSAILKKGEYSGDVWKFDGLGRCFAAITFMSPGILCLDAFILGNAKYVIYFLLIPACVLAIASSSYRIIRCIRSMNVFFNIKVSSEQIKVGRVSDLS